MKKLAILFFIGALALGVAGALLMPFGNVFSFTRLKSNWRGVEGSGNIVRETRDVKDFKGIEAGGAFEVNATIGPAFSVEVEGDDNLVPLVETVVHGGWLRIESDKGYNTKQKIKIHITAPDISRVKVTGAAHVDVTGIANDRFEIDASGGSRVTVAGTTEAVEIDISGGAKALATDLTAAKGNVDSSGGASVEVSVTGDLNAEASGGSRIYYVGTPANLKQDASGGAKISQK